MSISICDRCQKPANVIIMSIFNMDMCCTKCIEAERAHPDCQMARDEELKQLQAGNYNYEGIGLPDDLKPGE